MSIVTHLMERNELIEHAAALTAQLAEAQRERDAATAALAPLDAVVHALGIEDSHEDAAECIRDLQAAAVAAREAAIRECASAVAMMNAEDAPQSKLLDRAERNVLALLTAPAQAEDARIAGLRHARDVVRAWTLGETTHGSPDAALFSEIVRLSAAAQGGGA